MSVPVKWVVLQAINHHGRDYAPGEAIDVDPSTAFQLVKAGVIEAAIEKPAPPAPRRSEPAPRAPEAKKAP